MFQVWKEERGQSFRYFLVTVSREGIQLWSG